MVEGGELSRQFHHRPRPRVSKSCVNLQFATDVGSGCGVGGLIVNKGHGTWDMGRRVGRSLSTPFGMNAKRKNTIKCLEATGTIQSLLVDVVYTGRFSYVTGTIVLVDCTAS